MLLENYHTQIDEIVQMCEKNVSSIKTTDHQYSLGFNRNQLLLLSLRFSSVLCPLVRVSLLLLCMVNLETSEHSDTGFEGIIMLSAFTILLVLTLILKKVES